MMRTCKKKRPPYAGGGIRKKAAYAAFSSALPEGYGNIRRFFPAKTSTITLCFIPPPGDTSQKAHTLHAERSPAGQTPLRAEHVLPPLPLPGHDMEKGRQAAPPPSTGPAPFSFSQKNSAFSLPAPASGESPGHDCGNLLSRLPHRGKAVTPRSVPHVFPARKTGCLSPSEGSRPSPRALAKGFVMRTSGRPAHRRKHRFSPPACIPPAHGPSGCRR